MDEKAINAEEKNTETEEEMEQETPETDKSSDEESASGTGSDDDESSDLDEEEIERRRTDCLHNMLDLEKQYADLKQQLYRERLRQVETKLVEVELEKASEYLSQLRELQEDTVIRTQVVSVLKEMRIKSIDTSYDCEKHAAYQNMESEKMLLFESVKEDLEDKIRRLEEDRHNIDISSDLWSESLNQKKNRKRSVDPLNPNRRKKTVTVTGPFIVYMLHDMEILEDWTIIKKALKQQQQHHKRKPYF